MMSLSSLVATEKDLGTGAIIVVTIGQVSRGGGGGGGVELFINFNFSVLHLIPMYFNGISSKPG